MSAGNDAMELATSVLSSNAPQLKNSGSWVPPQLAQLVERLLDYDPSRRPASGEEVLIELSPVRDTEASPLRLEFRTRRLVIGRSHAA